MAGPQARTPSELARRLLMIRRLIDNQLEILVLISHHRDMEYQDWTLARDLDLLLRDTKAAILEDRLLDSATEQRV